MEVSNDGGYSVITVQGSRLYHRLGSRGGGSEIRGNGRGSPGGGALGYFLGEYVPPGTPNWHPVLKKKFP